jgi:hypothetical protein
VKGDENATRKGEKARRDENATRKRREKGERNK